MVLDATQLNHLRALIRYLCRLRSSMHKLRLQGLSIPFRLVLLLPKWETRFALNTVPVHWCWVTAHLCEEQMSTCVTAVSQACCQPVLQSSSEQREIHFALNRVAVHWCWVTARLCEEQMSTCVTAVSQACCEPVLQSSTEQREIHFALNRVAVHWCWTFFSHLHDTPQLHSGKSALRPV